MRSRTIAAAIDAAPLWPIPIVPTFGVPLAVIVHCLSLWQLHRRSRASSDGTVHIEHALHSAT
jgi:hypothetical protein